MKDVVGSLPFLFQLLLCPGSSHSPSSTISCSQGASRRGETWRHALRHVVNSQLVCCSVQFSCAFMSDSLRPHGLQHSRPPCPSPTHITSSWSLLKLMSVKSVMASNHLVLCCPLLPTPSIFPRIRVFPVSQFLSGGQSVGVSASASVFPVNIQH